jgi:hypothetical protein
MICGTFFLSALQGQGSVAAASLPPSEVSSPALSQSPQRREVTSRPACS